MKKEYIVPSIKMLQMGNFMEGYLPVSQTEGDDTGLSKEVVDDFSEDDDASVPTSVWDD